MSDEEKLEKASFVEGTEVDLKPNEERMAGGQQSLFSLSTLNGVIYEEVRKELKDPLNKKIYKQMMLDDCIKSPYTLMEMMVSAPNWRSVAPKTSSNEEKSRAKMINYMIKSTKRDWSEYVIEAFSYVQYGFWCGEKVYNTLDTPHGAFKGITDIKTISQDTIDRWHFWRPTGDYVGLRQDLSRIVHNSLGQLEGKVDIPSSKYLHLRNSPKRDNPEGESLLNAIYTIWKYKALLEEYLTIGVIKDMAGMPVFGVHADVLANASADPTGPDAKRIKALQDMGQAMHAGDLNSAIVPLAYNDKGNPLYTFKLQGIEGGKKQYDTLEIIKHYNQRILIRFFSDVLSLGSDGSGSFALSDNKLSLVELACQHHLKTMQRMFNHDLMRQIYKRNKWVYDPETSCSFEYDKLNDGDVDSIAKSWQNFVAVGLVRPSKQIEDYILGLYDQEPYDENTEFLDTVNNTRIAEGKESGLPNGTGDSTAFGADRNTANLAKINMKLTEALSAYE